MSRMASERLWCSVLGCNKEHSSHFDVPKSDPLKTQWLSFVFEGNIPHDQRQCFHVCANHFTRLLYKRGSVKLDPERKEAAPEKRIGTNYSCSCCTSRRTEVSVTFY